MSQSVMRHLAALAGHVTPGSLAMIIVMLLLGMMALLLTFAKLEADQRRDVIKLVAAFRSGGRRLRR